MFNLYAIKALFSAITNSFFFDITKIAVIAGAVLVQGFNFYAPGKVMPEIVLGAQIVTLGFLAIFTLSGVKEIWISYKEEVEYQREARRIGFIKD